MDEVLKVRQIYKALSFLRKIVRVELISDFTTQSLRVKDSGITVKLSSVCKIVSHFASFRGSRELFQVCS